jgi:TetR/AcrR family transcriptional regulator, tetracycline repressor protein
VPARRARPARTPRGSLSRDKVLAAALELARGGLDAVSMRALGARLGADPTAVYRYFRTKDELLDAMADAVVAGDRPFPQTGQPAEDLAATFENFRRSLLAHPALVPIVARRPPAGQATREGADRVLALLSGAGLDTAAGAAAYQALLFYTLGHALLEAPYALMGPDATGQERQQVRGQLAASSPGRGHLAAAAPRLYTDMDRQFRYGLDLMLTGLGLRKSAAR